MTPFNCQHPLNALPAAKTSQPLGSTGCRWLHHQPGIQVVEVTTEEALGDTLASSKFDNAAWHKTVASGGYAERMDNHCTNQRP